MLFFELRGPVHPGETCLNASETGIPGGGDSIAGPPKGTGKLVFETLQDPDLEWLILDSTVIRAHACAAGAKKKRTAQEAKKTKPWDGAEEDSEPRSKLQ